MVTQSAYSSDDRLIELVVQYGGPLSPVVFDQSCELFTVPGVPGAIPYRRGLGRQAVALGGPVCAPAHEGVLVEAFRDDFRRAIFAGAGRRIAQLGAALGFASVQFGEELILDPRRGLPRGRHAHGLRRKLNHARHGGVSVVEYRPASAVDPALEAALEEVGHAWLAGRRGLHAYVAHIDLFHPRALRRWFYARREGAVEGLLSLVRLGAESGWLLEHLLSVPSAPVGTSELLVAVALEILAAEGCPSLSFGTSTAHSLGEMAGLSPRSQWLGRRFFAWAQRAFHVDSIGDFRRKFGEVDAAPSYLLFHPPRIGLRELYSLLRAFNIWH